ncbi:hypothetical protein AQ490_19300 [Wenjunlia vitaminophila]|uniref:Uncharacterized protein n=1 Tax=Wenjunlia vitaminophila TaxID=76728 RepID=A0A0T6LUZ3_WENVI|nr:hypothetical protein [Wenjunlia vitaminophila]KRV49833.1 hypothetical protein AQ490_19300 [Wenjunlia vitaminophila]
MLVCHARWGVLEDGYDGVAGGALPGVEACAVLTRGHIVLMPGDGAFGSDPLAGERPVCDRYTYDRLRPHVIASLADQFAELAESARAAADASSANGRRKVTFHPHLLHNSAAPVR